MKRDDGITTHEEYGKDVYLMRKSFNEIRTAYNEGKLKVNVMNHAASQAAANGLDVGKIASVSVMLIPILIIAAIPLAIFHSWATAIGSLLLALVFYKVTTKRTILSTIEACMENEELFNMFRKNKLIWFEAI